MLYSFILSLAFARASQPIVNNTNFTYWCEGSCDSTMRFSGANPEGGLILMGGGTDTDDAFKQLIQWSDNGNILIIRAYGDDAYNPYIRDLGKTHSVATLLTKNRQAADDDEAIKIISSADAIFFAGGDQWTYLQEWEGTALQKTVQKLIQEHNIPVGGTSAGCDIQGGEIYTAANGTVVSKEALRDPYNFRVALQPFPFINHTAGLIANAIVDTHFITRDRMGRLVAFIARLWHDDHIHAFGIGIDEQTAIAIDSEGKGTMMKQGHYGGRAFVLTPTHTPSRCSPGEDLQFEGVVVQKLIADNKDKYDFVAMKGGASSQRYNLSARDGKLHPSDPYSPP